MRKLKATLIAVTALCFLSAPSSTAQAPQQVNKSSQINWMTWEEAMTQSREDKRKILLDIYTEWCKFCKHMEKTTFQQPDIAAYINANFYPVKLDAELKKELEYKDETYNFVKNGKMGYHELAAELLRGRLSFPALVFLDEELNIIQSFVGYKSPRQFEQIATYFASDQYKRTPWSTYQRSFKSMIAE